MAKEIFIGIDLGTKEKKTTGLCILEKKNEGISILKSQVIFGKEIFQEIRKYLKETKVIAIDAPLTKGKGKGEMRLYEKFLSKKIFRKEKINPIPPALMPWLCNFARELVKKLEKRGFVLDINLIETFPTFVKKISKQNLLTFQRQRNLQRPGLGKTEHQKAALICAQLAFFHSQFRTRYLGYRDGFLFLPEFSFWKRDWMKKFSSAWQEKEYLKYRHLITNLF